MKKYTTEDLIYFAGFVDGEAHIAIQKQPTGYGIRFDLTNSDINILKWMVEKFGGHLTLQQQKGTPTGVIYISNKDTHIWHLDVYRTRRLLPELIPYLKVKKGQAILLLEYMDKQRNFAKGGCPLWYRQWQEQMYNRIKALNKDDNSCGRILSVGMTHLSDF